MQEFYKNEIYIHKNELYHYAQLRILSKEDAEDLVVAVLQEAWEKIYKFKSGSPTMPLLMTMLKHQIGKYKRSPIPIPVPDEILIDENMRSVEKDIAAMLESEENMKAIFCAIDELDVMSAKIITIYLIDNKTVKRASEQLQLNYNTALWMKNRALKQLQKTLKDKGIRPSSRKGTIYSFIFFAKGTYGKQAITI